MKTKKTPMMLFTVITLLVMTLFMVSSVFAVHDAGLFELDTRAGVDGDQDKKNDPIPAIVGDGNTIDEAAPGDDWENVYSGTSSAFVTSFVEDTFANNNINNGAEPFVVLRTPEDTFFTGGGSKDTNGIQDGPWKYKIVSDQVPDKNDIVNAFAAAYDDPNDGHTIFYFGLDTLSVNGDANAGFWFFRQPVGLNPQVGDTGTFSGEHTDGDIFVAVAYTQGGSVGDIDVYEWQGDDATGSLMKILEGQDCATADPNDDVCGVINKLLPDQTFGEDPVFDYANTLVANNPLDPTSYQYESAAFVEFGLDVNAILGQDIGCFTTFLAETRSSQSETAQLKDFAFGAFPICSIAVEKTGDELSKVGDDVDYEIVVTNDGKATLYKQSITDTVLGDLTDDAGCGASLAPGESCTINVSRTVLNTDPDPLDNTVTVVYTEFADPLSLSFTDSASHSVNLFQPSIAFDKGGDATLSKEGDTVNYTLTLDNTSSSDSPNLTCTITDAVLSIDETVNLASGESHVINQAQVMPGAPDPYINTANVSCQVDGFSNVLTASDSWTVELFQPAIAVNKTGDNLSKVGDDVDYTITLSNNSSDDTPDLECTAEDTLFGTVFDGVLPLGDTVINRSRTVLETDPDPLGNTVTLTCSPVGFPNVLEESDDHSVNLFQPAIAVDKTGDNLSKVGDDVNYIFTLSNNSSDDTPDLACTAEDTLFGTVFDGVLPLGDTVINRSRTVLETDPDPLDNTVTLTCSPVGFPNVLEEFDDHSVNLFQPAIAIAKTGDNLSKVGDPVDYTITLSNNSSTDTPALTCTATDSLLGEVFNDVLPPGDTVLELSRTVQEGDPDPLVNTASMTCSVAGFPNVLSAGPAVHSTNLFQPDVEVIKTGPDIATIGDTITYNFTINNLSSDDSPDLILDSVTDTVLGDLTATAAAAGCGTLGFGGTCNFTFDYTIQATDPSPLVNVVTVLYHPDGFPNDITDDDDHSLEIPNQGCTPGFWQGGAGAQQWVEVDDPDWTGEGTNPYIHTTLFNDFFNDAVDINGNGSVDVDPRLNGYTMYDLVSSGGGSDPAVKAARDMVAAYLNETAFPLGYPADSLDALLIMWYDAVAGGDAGLNAFHVLVSGWNAPEPPGFCPLP